jgi:outer membrane protein
MKTNWLWEKRLLVAVSAAIFALQPVALAAPELTLEDSLALALKNNPSRQQAVSDKDKAAWALEEAKAGRGPTLALNESATRSDGGLEPGNSFGTSLRLSWPLYTGGRSEGLVDKAKGGLDVADKGVTKAEQQLKLDTTTAYFAVLQARNMVKVNEQAVANLQGHLDNVRAQFEAGTVAKADVLRSEVELANAQQDLIKAKNSHELAVASLNNIIGIPHDSQSVLKDELGYAKYNTPLTDSLALAAKNRPEVAQAADNVAIARAGQKVADSGGLPTLSLSAGQGWTGDTFPGRDSNWSVGMTLSWNIFDSGLTKAQSAGAGAAVDKALSQQRQAADDIALEVRQAYLSMKEAEERIQTSQVAVSKADEDLKIARTKYAAGAGTNIDVIDAQLALTKANTNYTQALYDYNVNQAKLRKATGQI